MNDVNQDVNKLMSDAQQQLDEHIAWLVEEIQKTSLSDDMKALLCVQATMIKLRMARIDAEDNASLLWEYPDELSVYLRAPSTPDHLRASLNGGRVVDMNQPGYSARRA